MGDDNEDGIYMHCHAVVRVLHWAVGLVDRHENVKSNGGSIWVSNPGKTLTGVNLNAVSRISNCFQGFR